MVKFVSASFKRPKQHMNRCVFDMPRLSLGKTTGFQVSGGGEPLKYHHEEIRKAAGMTPQFLNGTFGSFGFFLMSTFPPKKNTASPALCCIAGSSQRALLPLSRSFCAVRIAPSGLVESKELHWKFLPVAAKVQQWWKFPSFENTNFRGADL